MKMLSILVSDNNFNKRSLEIIQDINLNSKYYLERLETLKKFYDLKYYGKLMSIIKTINNFTTKYLDYMNNSYIQEQNIFKEKNLKQNNDFVKETVEYYFNDNNQIYSEIRKISEQFNNELRDMVLNLYDLEEASMLIIQDISKKIKFEEPISISKMLHVIG
jgi:hypothetical protein